LVYLIFEEQEGELEYEVSEKLTIHHVIYLK
jgi:hypothetical protein